MRASRGYSRFNARTGGPVARLRSTGDADLVEVLRRRRDAWGETGAFPTVLSLDQALDFIAKEPALWIRA